MPKGAVLQIIRHEINPLLMGYRSLAKSVKPSTDIWITLRNSLTTLNLLLWRCIRFLVLL